ncbi:MAG: leucyl-tRNA synthetase, partial [Candidatus Peribacteria bacterium]|nr:leucyl-tRNA synthetase [Candidatus Peribacteria bacterium]
EYLKKFDGELQHLWGEGVHHENVDSDKQFHTTLEYIQQNPEKSDISSEGRILSQLPLSITIFTTRPDTLFGATYMVLAPEHPLVDVITFDVHRAEVDAYKKLASKKTEIQRKELNKDKSGVFTGAYAINPVNNEKMPIWIADYVLTNYGTGAIMAVPGHDERDWEFAKKYNLPILEVVKGGKVHEAVYTGDGEMVNSDFVNGLKTEEARKKMIEWLEEKGIGKKIVNFRLRDWLVSRQRYWGAPIPIVYDPQGNAHPVPEEHLPWLLPTDVEFRPNGESPLRLSKEFVERTEKIFGKGWRPEYDTMDTFVCSSFYYLRYLMADSSDEEKNQKPKTKNQKLSEQFIEKKLEEKWMPVDMYIGGPEHATMHLIYARFVMMALHDFGIVSHDEPFQKLVHQGLITKDGAKMSKSKGNVVSPDDYVDRYGADVFRMFLMFMGPFTDGGDWSDTGIKGIDRFVQRAWKLVTEKVTDAADDKKVLTALHASIKKVTESIEKLHFNTAISSLMEFLNAAEAHGAISKESAETFALLLAPLAPHLAEEMWEHLGHTDFIVKKTWPAFDPALLVSDTLTIAIQVNGKLRATIEVAAGATKDEVLALAKDHENVKKYIDGGIKKEIYVPGKLVSLVV